MGVTRNRHVLHWDVTGFHINTLTHAAAFKPLKSS